MKIRLEAFKEASLINCSTFYCTEIGFVFVRGCEKFIIALAYLFYLALGGSCLARLTYFLADLCSTNITAALKQYFGTFLLLQRRALPHVPVGALAVVEGPVCDHDGEARAAVEAIPQCMPAGRRMSER